MYTKLVLPKSKINTSLQLSGEEISRIHSSVHRLKLQRQNLPYSKLYKSRKNMVSQRNENCFSTEDSNSINPHQTSNPNVYITETNNTSMFSPDKKLSKSKIIETEESLPTKNLNILPLLKVKYSDSKNNKSIKKNKNNQIILNERYSKYQYLERTKEIARIKYSQQIKNEAKERLKNIQLNEISNLNKMIEHLKSFEDNFNSSLFNEYTVNIKSLYVKLDKEKTIAFEQIQKLLVMRKDKSILVAKIKKIQSEKEAIEKWIKLQLEIKNKKMINIKNIKKELEPYKGKTIFKNVDDFFDILKSLEDTNLLLLCQYNRNNDEVERLNEVKINTIKYLNSIGGNDEDKLVERENNLKLLKIKHNMLVKERNEIRFKMKKFNKSINSKAQNKRNILDFNFINLSNYEIFHLINNNNPLIQKYGQLYYDIYNVFNNCVNNLSGQIKIDTSFIKKSFKYKEDKMINMLEVIEKSLNFVLEQENYDKKNIENYDTIIIDIKNKVDLDKKNENSKKIKQIENQKYILLKEKIEQKSKKVCFASLRKVNMFPFNEYNKKKKNVQTSFEEKQETLSDFLSDEE